MIVRPLKTARISPNSKVSLFDVLDEHLGEVKEQTVVAITSKVVAICEERIIPIEQADKNELAIRESEYYLPQHMSKYGYSFTITHNTLVPVAGIDESNGNGYYILWPADPQKSANEIRHYLVKRFGLKQVGVVITDSTARPLHYGTEGVAISYSGFSPLNNYVGQKDLFGRDFKVSVSNVLDGLASSAVLVMGEGTEQTPVALIEDVPFVQFQDHDPTLEELDKFFISHMEDDLFEPFLRNMGWQKGGSNKADTA
jgi:dihydrofolate synthase / folylpolyglutamate synthase